MTQEEKIKQLQKQLAHNQEKVIQALALLNKSISDLNQKLTEILQTKNK